MSKFNELAKSVLVDEATRSVVTKKRSFYPRKIEQSGGLSPDLLECLNNEVQRLQEIDPSINKQMILKALSFEIDRV